MENIRKKYNELEEGVKEVEVEDGKDFDRVWECRMHDQHEMRKHFVMNEDFWDRE